MQMKTFEYANQNIRTCKSKHSNMQMQYVLFDSTFQGSELLLENNKFHENANDYYSKLLELVTYFTGELLLTSIKKNWGSYNSLPDKDWGNHFSRRVIINGLNVT